MWEIIAGGIITIAFGWIFSRVTSKDLRNATQTLAGFLEHVIEGKKIEFIRDRKGVITGLRVSISVDESGHGVDSVSVVKRSS